MLFLPGKHQHFICQNIFIGDPYVGFKLIILIGSGVRFIRTGGDVHLKCRSPPSVSPQRGLPGGYTS